MKGLPDWIEHLSAQARIGGARVFRDDQAYSLEGAAEVVRRLVELLERTKRTSGWAAASMGIAPGKLSEAIQGSAGNPEPVIRAVDKWLEAQALKAQAARPAGFARTRVAEVMYASVRLLLENGGIVLAHGPAGSGKTMTAQAIAADTPGAIFISTCTMGQTGLATFSAIARELRLHEKPSRARLFEAVAAVLRDTGRLLIVDEIHKLAGRRNDEALHALRDLHDATGCPMLWLGMSNIAQYIQAGHASGFEPLDQIYSRITLWVDLTEMAQGRDGGPGLASIEDIRRFLAARQLRITGDGEAYLQALANEFGAGAYRTLDKLLQLAAKFAQGAEIDAAMLQAIQARRLGIGAAEVIETRMAARAARAVPA